MAPFILQDLWAQAKFEPNKTQREAIEHTIGPVFLTAGPGSGKTRVLLWRTVNLIVFGNVSPSAIFLSTFTEKAARQLKQGLQVYIGLASNLTGRTFDLSQIYVGTLHSLCRKILADRRLSADGRRTEIPTQLDQLDQYFFLHDKKVYETILQAADLTVTEVNQIFGKVYRTGGPSTSRHVAVLSCIELFNRLSEESVDEVEAAKATREKPLKKLLLAYRAYKQLLASVPKKTDLSLLQQAAFQRVGTLPTELLPFEHVIVDEYQDTNAIQEKLIFSLARRTSNLCVVGDDDQALYRFRGATVENFVDFPARCQSFLSKTPKRIPLATNYRSQKHIVEFYDHFIKTCDWKGDAGTVHRVVGKKITAHHQDNGRAVFIADRTQNADSVCEAVATATKSLIEAGKVEDPNQIAFLFPSLDSPTVHRMKRALEAVELDVYAPRAGRFFETDEATLCVGLFLHVFGKPTLKGFGRDIKEFNEWLDRCEAEAAHVCKSDTQLTKFLGFRRSEIEQSIADFSALESIAVEHGWALTDEFDPTQMQSTLGSTPKIDSKAKNRLRSPYLRTIAERRKKAGRPLTLRYVITSATSPDWSLLDLFYQFTGFKILKASLDLAEGGKDEGPAFNLAEISKYIARFIDQRGGVLSPSFLRDGKFIGALGSYLFSLFRLGETEFEDEENPFPKGRIPFLTIHQAKGLEFPVVVIGNPRKDDKGASKVETFVRKLTKRPGEPLERCAEFDIMRMFYVALSRAKNLLIVVDYKRCQMHDGLRKGCESLAEPLSSLSIPAVPAHNQIIGEDLPKPYSYTADFSLYEKCARQYMLFRRLGFVPSRSQTQFFGSLVHKTIEDLHHMILKRRAVGKA